MKIAFVGAGSQKFVLMSIGEIMEYEQLHGSTIVLMDIDAERLAFTARLAEKLLDDRRVGIRLETTTDQRAALDGADFVITTVMVGGRKHYESDTFIPARYGVSVASGDTTGPGAVFRLVRTLPFLRTLVANTQSVSNDAWILSFVNPMAMITGALHRLGHARSVGFCHAVPLALGEIGKWLSIPVEEIEFTIGGVNHLNFFLTLTHRGRDLYPRLLAKADWITENAETWDAESWTHVKRGYERVRMEILKYLGYFPLEGPWHQGEYYPWFRKNGRQDTIYGPETGWALSFDKYLFKHGREAAQRQLDGLEPILENRSVEYDVPFIHSLTGGAPRTMYLNIANQGCITNLPEEACVEVECTVDKNGIHPAQGIVLPPQIAGIVHQHVTVHELALQGAFEGDRAKIRMALQADPLTGAVLSLPEIERMTDELLRENESYFGS
ncbi:MAG: alpha-glucosidase/alpha-galactosidase [Chitinivibrionales bacterium]|nr:alpha-glucosidase/alpha-galactosidase [Chitinivibrionales bacterium]